MIRPAVEVQRIASEAAHERYRDSHQSTQNYSNVCIHGWNSHGNVRAYFSRGIPGETTSRITTAVRCRLLRTRVWA